MSKKICTKCLILKDRSEFYVRRDRGKDSIRPQCKDCTKKQLENLPKVKYSEMSEFQKTRRKEIDRRSRLKNMYGITPEEYEHMLEMQKGCCAICKSSIPGGKWKNGTFMVDHNHKTGEVRHLLCNRCNIVVGLIEDQPELGNTITSYLMEVP